MCGAKRNLADARAPAWCPEAVAEVLVFVDDDNVLAPDYLSRTL